MSGKVLGRDAARDAMRAVGLGAEIEAAEVAAGEFLALALPEAPAAPCAGHPDDCPCAACAEGVWEGWWS